MPSPAAPGSPGGLVPAPQVPSSDAGHGVPQRRRRPRLALGFASPLGAGVGVGGREGEGRCSTLVGVSAAALVQPPPPLPLPRATVWRSLRPGADSRCSESRGPGFPRRPPWRTCPRDVGGWPPRPPLPARDPARPGDPPLLGSGLGIRALIAAAPRKCPGGPAPAAGSQAKKKRKRGVGRGEKGRSTAGECCKSRPPLVCGIGSCPPSRVSPRRQLPTPDRCQVTPECQGFPR